MNKVTFLSICIPTWNRCEYLKENILSLISQVEKFSLTNVEICISDNASSDKTEQLCRALCAQYSYITYHRASKNFGANANFQTVLEKASGEYLWLLGDDDFIVDDVIVNVMNDMIHFKPALIVGPAVFDDTGKKATHRSINKHLLVDKQYLINTSIIELAGKMSGLIFRKSDILPVLVNAKSIIEKTRTPWPHLAWVILLMHDTEHKMLLLPYGINQLIDQNWHNLLFTGKELINIHFIKLQELIVALKNFVHDDYDFLINRSIAYRTNILFKCVFYATYLDSYSNVLIFGSQSFFRIIGLKNMIYYFLVLLLPLSIPVFIRRFGFKIISLMFNNTKIKKTIARLEIAQSMFKDDHNRALFDVSKL